MSYRIGSGFDVHRLVSGRPLIIGGVHVPWDRGLDGHSDADVLLHAICDALLGAVALGDIGQHFPPGTDAWRDADSRDLLRRVGSLLMESGWQVENVDSTIIAERPKLAPYIADMRNNIARDLALDPSAVSVKATTTEGLGYCGREEGMAAQASVLVCRRAS